MTGALLLASSSAFPFLGCRLPPRGTNPVAPAPVRDHEDENAATDDVADNPPTGIRAERGVLTVGRIEFETGKAALKQASQPTLVELREFLKAHPEITKIRIEGHTDNRGDKFGNKQLSANRAIAVREWLVQGGIGRSRLEAVGMGNTRPVADDASEQGRAANRRAEFHVVEYDGRPYAGQQITPRTRDVTQGEKVVSHHSKHSAAKPGGTTKPTSVKSSPTGEMTSAETTPVSSRWAELPKDQQTKQNNWGCPAGCQRSVNDRKCGRVAGCDGCAIDYPVSCARAACRVAAYEYGEGQKDIGKPGPEVLTKFIRNACEQVKLYVRDEMSDSLTHLLSSIDPGDEERCAEFVGNQLIYLHKACAYDPQGVTEFCSELGDASSKRKCGFDAQECEYWTIALNDAGRKKVQQCVLKECPSSNVSADASYKKCVHLLLTGTADKNPPGKW